MFGARVVDSDRLLRAPRGRDERSGERVAAFLGAWAQHRGRMVRCRGVGMTARGSFEVWYRESYARLSTSMLGLTGDRDIASDATDEAFARAWRHWDRGKEMASPEGWTYRVALNVARSRARRRRVERRLLPRLVNRTSVPAPAGEVWDIVRDLPTRQRTAVVLRYVGDFDEREIAVVMGVTRGTVAATLSAARHNLGIALMVPDTAEERS